MQVIFIPFVDRKKFAELTGLTLETVQGMIRRGHIKCVRVGKRSMVDLTSFLPSDFKKHD